MPAAKVTRGRSLQHSQRHGQVFKLTEASPYAVIDAGLVCLHSAV